MSSFWGRGIDKRVTMKSNGFSKNCKKNGSVYSCRFNMFRLFLVTGVLLTFQIWICLNLSCRYREEQFRIVINQ